MQRLLSFLGVFVQSSHVSGTPTAPFLAWLWVWIEMKCEVSHSMGGK